jgi:hypothetical protein
VTVLLLGATGTFGAALHAAIAARGSEVVVRGSEVVAEHAGAEVVAAALREGTVRVVVDATAAPAAERIAALERALQASVAVITTSLDPEVSAWAAADGHVLADARGVPLLAGTGVLGTVGSWLVPVAAAHTVPATAAHVTYALPDRGAVRRVLPPGLRAELPGLLASGGAVLEHGILHEELPGETRRLAWFPRPVGPTHAASIPSPEPSTVPGHLGTLTTVRTYLAMSGWRAEVVQAAGNLARVPRTRDLVRRRVVGSAPTEPDRSRRLASERWACVAELDGAAGVARAWAYGRDPVGTGARALAEVIAAIDEAAPVVGDAVHGSASGDVPARRSTGRCDVADLLDPRVALDALSVVTDLRWSTTPPHVEVAGRTG